MKIVRFVLESCTFRFRDYTLLKFYDLQDFYARMFIVADIKRKEEFEHKMSFYAFENLKVKKRVSFLSYEILIKQYEMELEKQSFDFVL